MAKDLLDRLGDKFTVGDGCWEWLGCPTPNGYGQFRIGKHRVMAHRVVYELVAGPLMEGTELDHLCRNKLCVRPDHLEQVSHVTNVRRGRAMQNPAPVSAIAKAATIKRSATHCKRGHSFSPENTRVDAQGRRKCRVCSALHMREYRRRKKGAV